MRYSGNFKLDNWQFSIDSNTFFSGSFAIPVSEIPRLSKLNFYKANFAVLSDHLADFLVLYDQFSFESLETSWLALKNAIVLSTSLSVPHSIPSTDNLPHWFNSSVRHQLNKVRSYRKHVKHHLTSTSDLKLKHMEEELQNLILSAKESYLSDLTVSLKAILKSFILISGIYLVITLNLVFYVTTTN